jgi:hypothetical protein
MHTLIPRYARIVTTLAAAFLTFAPGSAEAAYKRCGNDHSAGVAKIRADDVRCKKARVVARRFRAAGPSFPSHGYPYGFVCHAGRFIDETTRKASCRHREARIRFVMFAR